MKILHINSYFSTSKFYKNFYDKQIEQNVDISVYVPVSKSFVQPERDFGDYTTISKCFNQFDRYSFYFKQYKILKDIRSKYNVDSYDILHAHSLFTNGYIAYKLNEKYGTPYVVAVRNTDVNRFFEKMYHLRSIGINILNKAQRIIFLSESYKKLVINKFTPIYLRQKLIDKVEVIPNGIDDFWFKNTKQKKANNESINILYVGDINENKNLLTTVKAIKTLIKEKYKVRYTVVGRIKNNDIFNKIIKESFVDYIEPIPKEELINIYQQHDIFVMPSIRESFGLVYAEAISQGLLVIYSKGQGFDGQFSDGEVGYSVESFNHDKISKIIKDNFTLLDDFYENNISKSTKFKWDSIVDIYNKIYKEIYELNLYYLRRENNAK